MPIVDTYYEKTAFPFELVDIVKKMGINGMQNKGYGSAELSLMMSGVVTMELFRADPSVGTFVLVHNCIGMDCIYTLGSEEQKQRYLPDCVALKKICSFGLTEREYGSDATSIQTTAKPVEGGYLINGNKRWIGNVTIGDYMILWARNTETKKIQGFVLDLKSKGVDAKKIEGKYAL